MASPIEPISLAQVDGDIQIASPRRVKFTGNAFEDVLSKAVEALDDVSKTELHADKLMNDYIAGKADIADVMLFTSKTGIMVQLAVTVVNSAVNTFKEITQMQV